MCDVQNIILSMLTDYMDVETIKELKIILEIHSLIDVNSSFFLIILSIFIINISPNFKNKYLTVLTNWVRGKEKANGSSWTQT